MTSAEIDVSIPDFLLVKNRKPLSKKRRAVVDAWLARGGAAATERSEYRKPKGTSWEEWDAHMAKQAAEKHAASLARVSVLKEKYGDRVARALRPKKLRVAADWKIIVLVKECPYKSGTAGARVFAKYKDGLSVGSFEQDAAGLAGRRRPIDMLMYDVRKQYVRVEVGGSDHGR